MIRAANIARQFSGESAPVISDVSFTADAGEVLSIIGPSGVGKTTLLRLLALFDPPDAGELRLDGTNPWTLDSDARTHLRRRVGMVFQQRSLFTGTVASNASYGIRVRESWPTRVRDTLQGFVGDSTVDAAVADALETVGLAEKHGAPASELSAGEAQRVAFARALAVNPDVLLLDEPTSNLDPRNTAVIEESMLAAADRGIAVVLATHDMAQAWRVADRTAVFLDGTCIESGRTARVFDSPQDERARAFIDGELVY